MKVLLVALAALIALLVVSLTSIALYFQDRGLLGTSIAGHDISRMSQQEVADLVTSEAQAVRVALTVDSDTDDLTLSDLGTNVDVDETVNRAFERNKTPWTRIVSMFHSKDYPVEVTVDQNKLNEYSKNFADEKGNAPVDAAVTLDEETGEFRVSEAEVGHSVDLSELKATAMRSAQTLQSQQVTIDLVELAPAVSTTDAQSVADEANSIVELPVEIHGRSDTHSPSATEKASWITIGDDDDNFGDISIDEDAATAWVVTLGHSTSIEPVSGVRNVNSRGEVTLTVSSGSPGYLVNNEEEVAQALIDAIHAKSEYSGSFSYDTIEQTFENRLIADGAESLAYAAAPGEKWIDINLSTTTVTGYEGATPVHGPVYMVPGAPETPTVTGSFKVWSKVPSQTMTGFNVDGTRYRTEGVPWILYFHGGYAVHGAPWRSSFGWSGPGGSHGCVNMPVGPAKALYDWASVGTPVVSHY